MGTPIVFVSKSGELVCTQIADGLIELNFPSEASRGDLLSPGQGGVSVRDTSEPHTVALISSALSLPVESIVHICRNRMDVLVEVTTEDFQALKVDINKIGEVEYCRVLSITARAPEGTPFDFQSRSFAPAVGVPEVSA